MRFKCIIHRSYTSAIQRKIISGFIPISEKHPNAFQKPFNMQLKLSKTQLEGFYLLVSEGLKEYPPLDVPEQLVWELMDKLNERLRLKVKKIKSNAKNDMVMTLNKVEACTFYCWYQAIRDNMETTYQYGVIVTDKIYHQIDKEYA